jgi:hypothetical protein
MSRIGSNLGETPRFVSGDYGLFDLSMNQNDANCLKPGGNPHTPPLSFGFVSGDYGLFDLSMNQNDANWLKPVKLHKIIPRDH